MHDDLDPALAAARRVVGDLVASWGEALTVGNGLEAATAVREGLDAYVVELVRHAREAGATWAGIGAALGVSAQAAHQKFRSVVD